MNYYGILDDHLEFMLWTLHNNIIK